MGFFGHAQENPIVIDTFEVIGTTSRHAASHISIDVIQSKMAGDIGQLMPLFTGVQLRSYGGLGGLKTVSFRSLGANHTSVVSDYFQLSQTQSGQNDLGQLPADFLSSLSLVWCDPVNINLPVHSKLSGSTVAIETYLLPDDRKFRFTIGTQVGSFGQADAHSLIARRWGKSRMALAGKIRRFDGSFPFSYENGSERVHTRRENADLFDQYAQGSFSWQGNRNQWHLEVMQNQYNKGLPGAVVFYNPTTGQRLHGGGGSATLRHKFTGEKLVTASGISAQLQEVNYVDSTYLNTQGYLHNRYRTFEYGAHTQLRWQFSKHTILAGAESRSERLLSAVYPQEPQRFNTDVLLGWQMLLSRFSIHAQSGFTYIEDRRPAAYMGRNWFWQPAVMLAYGKAAFQTSAGFKYTVRQASFQELYFNQFTLLTLKPEEAQLYWLKCSSIRSIRRIRVTSSVQPFYTFQKNKILALPTKNLFVWSIQNIGISDAAGTEANLQVQFRTGKLQHDLTVGYTFQYTRDLSNPQSQSYLHHLAYMPLHSGTATWLVEIKKSGLSVGATYQGSRYTLNQNIPANQVPAFVLLDVALWHRFAIKTHDLTLRGGINNVLNTQYAYIRYFVMPGINYTVNLLFSW